MLIPIIEHLIDEVILELVRLGESSRIPNGGLSREFLWALIDRSQKQKAGSPIAAQTARKALESIRSKVSGRFLISDLAEELGVHRSQLSRWFKASYGVTLSYFLQICRIEKSIELLEQNELSITEVALECGFNDQSHFTRSFREAMNTTPAKWRDRFVMSQLNGHVQPVDQTQDVS